MKSWILALLPLWLSPAAAQTAPDPAEAAERFTLDLPTVDPDADVTIAPEPEPAPAPTTRFSLDTPIADLIANFRSKAVLDRNLPGMSTDKNFARFKALSLRKLQPLSDGRLTDALIAKTGAELAAID